MQPSLALAIGALFSILVGLPSVFAPAQCVRFRHAHRGARPRALQRRTARRSGAHRLAGPRCCRTAASWVALGEHLHSGRRDAAERLGAGCRDAPANSLRRSCRCRRRRHRAHRHVRAGPASRIDAPSLRVAPVRRAASVPSRRTSSRAARSSRNERPRLTGLSRGRSLRGR